MKKMILTVALAVGMTVATTVQAQTTRPGEAPCPAMKQMNYIEVSGSATTYVTPNKIEISIRLNETDSKGKISLAAMNRSLATAMHEAGVDMDKQLVVTDQSSNSPNRRNIYQYRSYKLTVGSAEEVATVFERLEANGIGNAEIVEIDHTDIKTIRKATKVEAMQDARTTAVTLAEAVGQKIGKAIYVQDYSTPYYGSVRQVMPMMSKAAADVAGAGIPDVQFQDIQIDQRVTVRFVLE